jgi:two-component system NtrC family sensor kinase
MNFAVVGGGRACKSLLELLEQEPFQWLNIRIVGVCDIDPEAEGLRLARAKGIYTTHDFRDLFEISGLDGLIELTNDRKVLIELARLRPRGLGVLDHNMGLLFWDLFFMNQKLKSAEQQARLEKTVSDFLIHQIQERIVVLRPDFTIVDANEPYLQAVGRTKEEVIGAHCYEITHGFSSPCSAWQPELGCPMTETLKTGGSAQVIHEHMTPGDQPIYCDLVTHPVKDVNGEIVRVIEIWRDITGELASRWEKRVKALENDMRKLIQEDRMISLGKLAASCVHEINNPIQGLLTFCGLMQEILAKDGATPADLDRFQSHLSLMSEELERCGRIVSGLLSFARESMIETKDLDLNEVLRSVLSLTRHKMELQNIAIHQRFSDNPLMVRGDLNQLQQCFLNLIFNAIEAMPNGGRITVISELDVEWNQAEVRVQDTGSGIAEEDVDHIFDPFFTTKGEGEGTGLGLSIVYGVVQAHRGTIRVQSQVETGTEFILSFPLQ